MDQKKPVVVSGYIAARPETVWATLTDLTSDWRAHSGVSSTEILTQGPLEVGSRWRETREHPGIRQQVEIEVIAAEAPRHLAVGQSGGPFPFLATFSITPSRDGSLLTIDFVPEIRSSSGVVSILQSLTHSGVTDSVQRFLEGDLTALRSASEDRERGVDG